MIPLVDENDTIIGYKKRADIDVGRDIFRTASVWITNSQGDILLAQRVMTKRVDPGKWAEAVGGTVEGHDSYELTARREAEEELGLKDLQFTVGPKQFITDSARYFVQWYIAKIDQPATAFTLQADEVAQIAWIPRRQLERELREQPEKYIDAMAAIVRLFPSL